MNENKFNDSKLAQLWNSQMELAVTPELELNDAHPYIDSMPFLRKALQYFEGMEEYEKCAVLFGKIRSLSSPQQGFEGLC